MIIVVVTFKISNNLDASVLKEKFKETAPLYQNAEGLIRKNYIADMDTHHAGGVYCFDTMKNARKWFDDERIKWLTNRYSKPNLQFFDNPVIVDNVTGEIVA